jgi:23S rRNA pseudouridine2605 synthase
LTAEQLQSARAEAWRQSGNPILTADDAASWLRETGLCLFLPRGAQIAAPAPSFVEATLGAANATPAPAAIEAANELLLRLLTQGDAVALNLLGGLGSQPDFLATPETLPFIYALRGDKEWKRGPRGKSSPLVFEVWKLLDKEGSLTAAEVKDLLGRELTEAAALRALTELWNTLRIEPVYREYSSLEDPARWQPLDRAHAKQLQAGSTMSAGMAISALVSLYLQSSVAATQEEIEAFLSPLCSRSKVRDAVRGLSATRQLASVHLGGAELYHVEGSLPEFPEVEIVTPVRSADIEVLATAEVAAIEEQPAPVTASESAPAAGVLPRKRPGGLVRRSFAFRGEGNQDGERKPFAGARKPAGPGRTAGKPAQRTMGSARPGSTSRRPSTPGGTRKPYGTRSAPGSPSRTNFGASPDRQPFHPSEPWIEDRKPRPAADSRPAARAGEGSSPDRKPYPSRSAGGGDRKPFGARKTFGGDRKPFTPRSDSRPASRTDDRGGDRGSEREPFSPGQNRPFPPRSGAGAKPSFGGARKTFSPREGAGGERKPWVKREGGSSQPGFDRKPGSDRKPAFGGDRPFKPRGDRPQSSSDRPFPPRREGGRPSFGAPRKPFDRNGAGSSERRTSSEPGQRGFGGSYRGGARDRKPAFGAAGAERPFKPRGERPASAGSRPYTPRSGSTSRPSGDRKPAFGGPRKPFAAGGAESGFKPRPNSGSDARPNTRPDTRSGGSSYGRMGGSKPGFGSPRPSPRSGAPDRPSSPRPPRPATDRPRPSGPGKGPSKGPGGKARTSGFTSSGKPRSGVKPSGRPGPRAGRPPGAPGKPKSVRRKPDDQ